VLESPSFLKELSGPFRSSEVKEGYVPVPGAQSRGVRSLPEGVGDLSAPKVIGGFIGLLPPPHLTPSPSCDLGSRKCFLFALVDPLEPTSFAFRLAHREMTSEMPEVNTAPGILLTGIAGYRKMHREKPGIDPERPAYRSQMGVVSCRSVNAAVAWKQGAPLQKSLRHMVSADV
jgi:hypothetical protein